MCLSPWHERGQGRRWALSSPIETTVAPVGPGSSQLPGEELGIEEVELSQVRIYVYI
ncbi:hypothetical protein BGX38DRAFT_1154043 [Terfezia claveryi]|nr:hypothetical protein BGX38DRAFT_1154043 [Terfezia claveryi]